MAVNSFTHLEEITTSNTTTQTFFSHSVPENTSGKFQITAVARRLSDGATKGWSFDGVFKRKTGDSTVSTTILSAPLLGTSGDLTALLLASITVDTSGADVRVRATGLLGTDILWYADMNGNEMTEN